MTKKIGRRIMTVLMVLIVAVARFAIWPEYSAQHTYYATMIASVKHWTMFIAAMVISCIGLWVHMSTSRSRQRILGWLGAIVMFACVHLAIKEGLIGAGLLGVVRKSAWIAIVALVYLGGIHALGSWFNKSYIKLPRTVTNIILIMALGLVINLIMVYVLMLVGGLFSGVTRLLLLGGVGLVRYQRESLQQDYRHLANAWDHYTTKGSLQWWIQHSLLVIAIVYVMYGLQLSFIPYSTAWDANHAYMFFPKIWADNGGVYRSDGPRTSPFLRYAYIAQWFSSMSWLTPITGIARDTMAIVMNFLVSGVGILLAGTVLFDKISQWLFADNNTQKAYTMATAGLLLTWLTSGMGAFLVFVDNKTDLGILLLVVVALLSGRAMVSHMTESNQDENHQSQIKPQAYVILSGVFFAAAFLSKPTAFIDIAGFVTMVVTSQLGIFAALAMILGVVGLMAATQLKSTGVYLGAGASVAIFGGAFVLPAIRLEHLKKSRQRLRLLIIWVMVIVGSIVLLKLPYLLNQSHQPKNTKERMLQMLLSQDTRPQVDTSRLVASTGDVIMRQEKSHLTPETCSLKSLGMTEQQLNNTQRDIIGGSITEDYARYVGYGQRKITADDGVRYELLSGLFSSADGCYTWDSLASKICKQRDQIQTNTITQVLSSLSSYDYIQSIQDNLTKKHIFPQDAVKQLNEYYQSKTITTTVSEVRIPYRWLVPLNITFNRSLQNASSYYTDIGVVRLPALLIVLLGFLGSIFTANKRIIALTTATIIVRIIRILVADAIVRYGMGMIVWTIVAAVAVVVDRIHQSPLAKHHQERLTRLVVGPLFALITVQRCLNIMRISSQGAAGPFSAYRQGWGMLPTVTLDERGINIKEKLQSVSQEDIFNIQFPHYNVTKKRLNERVSGEGAFIAGTYLQYFLTNQRNIQEDAMVGSLWRKFSDDNPCAAYLRLRAAKHNLIVIDPNVATVVMGEGNESLRERFIMKEDDKGNRIDDGAMSMLVRLVRGGYVDILSTNNLAIHYAYTMPTEQTQAIMKQLGEVDEVAFRARFAMMRFLPRVQMNTYYNILAQMFFQRLGSYVGLQDMGMVHGEVMDTGDWALVQGLFGGSVDKDMWNKLSNTKKMTIYKYVSLMKMAQNPQTQAKAQQELSRILQSSITSQSQIVSFELK